MDQIIIKFARELGILPLSMDMDTQLFMNDIGIDPNNANKHYNRGLPPNVREACERVQQNIGMLHRADSGESLEPGQYSALERSVKGDLARLSAFAKNKRGILPFVSYTP